MSKRIILKKATRIEGNANIQIQVTDGRVETAKFMVEDFRGFEKLVQGKLIETVPHVVSRICGLCSTAHQVAGLQAVENALGVEVPEAVARLRQVAVWGEWIASHALSYFFLTLPDSFGEQGGIFALMRSFPEVAQDAFRLRRAGQRIVALLTKRSVHAVALGVGRFNCVPTAAELDELRRLATDVRERVGRLMDLLGERHSRVSRIPFPPRHEVVLLAYDGRPGAERFLAWNRSGTLLEAFDRETFGEHISEMRVDWSLAKLPYLTEPGFPDGILFVGPLARLFLRGGVLDDPELAGHEVARSLRDPATRMLDNLDECRLLEIVWAAKQIEAQLEGIDLRHVAGTKPDLSGSGWGIGVVEAPRGVLVHEYTVNRGVMERMRLRVATQLNNAYINLVLRELAEGHVEGDGLSAAGEQLIAHGVRVFDPCLTCATH